MDERRIYYSKFAVGEKPYCVWEWNLPERNLEYLGRVDPTYFDYVGRVNAKKLGTNDGQPWLSAPPTITAWRPSLR
jgi:hypothetical protein